MRSNFSVICHPRYTKADNIYFKLKSIFKLTIKMSPEWDICRFFISKIYVVNIYPVLHVVFQLSSNLLNVDLQS